MPTPTSNVDQFGDPITPTDQFGDPIVPGVMSDLEAARQSAGNDLNKVGNTIGNAIAKVNPFSSGQPTQLPVDQNDPGVIANLLAARQAAHQDIVGAGNAMAPYVEKAGPPLAAGAAIATVPEGAPWYLPILAGAAGQGAGQATQNILTSQPVEKDVAKQAALGGVGGAVSIPLGWGLGLLGKGLASLGASAPAKALIEAMGAPAGSSASMSLPSDVNEVIAETMRGSMESAPGEIPTAQELADQGMTSPEEIQGHLEKLQAQDAAATNGYRNAQRLGKMTPQQFFAATHQFPGGSLGNLGPAGVYPYQVGNEAAETLKNMATNSELGHKVAEQFSPPALSLLNLLHEQSKNQ